MLVSRAKRRRFGPNLWRSGCCPRWWWAGRTGALVRIAAAAQLDNLIITNVVTLKVGPVPN